MQKTGKVILKRGKEHSLLRKHPWVFSGAIDKTEGNPADGSWVVVEDSKRVFLGCGHFQVGSIAVRILSFEPQLPTTDFFTRKIKQAHDRRRQLNIITTDTNAFRLVHGEGDGLPGLIVDFYHGVAVIQSHSAGMHNDRALVADAIKDSMGKEVTAVYYRNQSAPGKGTGEYLIGMGVVPHIIMEHGNKFLVDWEEGQKTGFFLDQRDNRKLLAQLAGGRTVLNTFCYTGGFTVYALQAGAERVHSVDSSERAIDLARKNLELNGFDPNEHTCFAEDTFDFMKGKKDQYDMIILDPPAFAKHRESRHQAMKGYQRLNAEALRLIRPNGIIFTFSCSQVVDRQLFYDTVVSSAIQAGRDARVVHVLGQSPDHPVSIYHREGEYLKGLVLLVT